MKAVDIRDYGGADVLRYEELPVPDIGPDDILVKVHACGINPVDWKIRQGFGKEFLRHSFPLVLGWDIAGTVDRSGTRVTGFNSGDDVYSCPDRSRNGGYAEFIAIDADEVAPKPKSLSFVEAAGVPLASQTAWQALYDAGGLKAGQRVLIHGASGGVGTFAVQFAKLTGAYVFGTCARENVDLIKSLGVDTPIDYQHEDFSEVAGDIDLVLDTLGGETRARSWKVLRKGGVLVSTVGPPDPAQAAAHGVTGKGMIMKSSARLLEKIGMLFDERKLRVIIDSIFPLSKAKQAQEHSESGRVRGKIILKID